MYTKPFARRIVKAFLLGFAICTMAPVASVAQTNPYAPREAQVKPEKERRRPPVLRDTVPRYGSGRVDFNAGVVFPVQYFAQAEPGNPDAGYAAQGFGFGLGRFLPFGEQSPLGIQFSLGFVNMGATAFAYRLQSVLDDFLEADEDAEDETLRLDPDYRPRYHMIPFSVGLAYEGSGTKADVYARFMLHAALTGMNEFSVQGDESGSTVVNVGRGFSTGIGMELGARLHEVLRVGIAWQYLGRPEVAYTIERGDLPLRALDPINTSRPVSILSVNLGYSIDRSLRRRKGARIK